MKKKSTKKDKFNLKQEVIFMAMASHSKYILEKQDKHDKDVLIIARHFINYITKVKNKKYTKARSIKVNHTLKNVFVPIISEKMSPVIYLVISLDYLLNEVRHYESLSIFMHHKERINSLITNLETTENRDIIMEHHDKLTKFIEEDI